MRVCRLWKKCDWCGKMQFIGLAWITNKFTKKHYCCQACAEHKSQVLQGVLPQ